MRAAELDRRLRDRGHAHEVVGAREERRERGREGLPADDLHPDRRADQLLLGDVHLEVPLGERLAEELGVRRVVDLAVERDDARIVGAEAGQRLAVGLPRRDLRAHLVARTARRRRSRSVCALALGGLGTSTRIVADAAELLQRLLGVLGGHRLAVPAGLVLDLRVALALQRLARSPPSAGRSSAPPPRRRAWISSTSCPSIVIACQPKARNRSA